MTLTFIRREMLARTGWLVYGLFVLFALPAFAAGGACPGGTNYLGITNTTTLNTLATLGVNNCYYIAANGSDSNDGLSEGAGHPWAHAPGMPNCTYTCAGVTPAAGQGFIFRGGDTWHFGNSSATPYTGGTWTWGSGCAPPCAWNGTSSAFIYIGVDKTWFSGGSWVRPILTGDNPLTPNPGIVGDSVASCAHQIAGGTNNIWFVNSGGRGVSWYILDNFEMVGLCGNRNGQANGDDDYINEGAAFNALDSNLYIHGWTHVDVSSCVSNFPNSPCVNVKPFTGGDNGIQPDQQKGLTQKFIVVDGADSDPEGALCNVFDALYDTEYSIFRYCSQVVYTLGHVFHDNVVEFIFPTTATGFDGHGNMLELDGDEIGPAAYYNNVFRQMAPSPAAWNASGDVAVWDANPTGTTTYWFNNVFAPNYGTGGNNFNIGDNTRSTGVFNSFNNTFENVLNLLWYDCTTNTSGFTFTLNGTSNQYITDNSTQYRDTCLSSSYNIGGVFSTELLQSHSTANGQGYNSGSTYAWSPASTCTPSTCSTVQHGTNQTSGYCAALATAAGSDPTLSDAATACLRDTTYACTYLTSNHAMSCPTRTVNARPSSGAWDVGAYEFGGVVTCSTPTFSPVSGTVFTAPSLVTMSTSCSTVCYTTDGTTPTATTPGTCSHGTAGTTATVNNMLETLKAIGTQSGDTNSAVGTASYTLNLPVAAPAFNMVIAKGQENEKTTPDSARGNTR